jgi:hypothetical protein
MPGVTEQSQAVTQDAADDLNYHNHRYDTQHNLQLAGTRSR